MTRPSRDSGAKSARPHADNKIERSRLGTRPVLQALRLPLLGVPGCYPEIVEPEPVERRADLPAVRDEQERLAPGFDTAPNQRPVVVKAGLRQRGVEDGGRVPPP